MSDPQIRGRLFEHSLAPYRLDGPTEIRDWQDFLAVLEPTLRRFLPDLPDGALATELGAAIFKRTQGFVGDVRALLAAATASALHDGRGTLTLADLGGARLSSRARDGEALFTGKASPVATSQPALSRPARVAR